MKRIICIVILIITCFVTFFYSQEAKRLEPLKDNERLEYKFDQGSKIFNVYKVSNEKKVPYVTITGSSWGMYQITENKKGILFFKQNFEEYRPMYYLDGEKGTITSYGNIKFGAILDSKGQYVLLQDKELGDFCILNLETGDIEYRLAWNIKNRDEWYKRGARFSLLRAADKDGYDFLIEFGIERLTIAKGYLNIEEGKIKTEFDDSDKNEIELRDSVNYGEEYTGWY